MVKAFIVRTHRRIYVLLLALLCLLAYVNTLAHGLVLDDQRAVAQNPCVTGEQAGPRCAFSRDFWGRPLGEVGRSYRPLTTLSFALDWALAGGAAWMLHLSNMLWHLLATLLLYLLALRLSHQPAAAWCGAAAFALLAVHTEAVAGVVGRANVLATTLGLAALVLCCHQQQLQVAGRQVLLRCLAALLLAGLALLCQELAVLVPLFLVLCSQLKADPWPRQLAIAGGAALLLGSYLVARQLLLGQITGPPPDVLNNPAVALPGLERLLLGLELVQRSVSLMVLPLNLSAEYGYGAIAAPPGFSWQGFTGAALLVLLGAGLFAARRRSLLVALGCGVLLAGLLLLANVVTLLPTAFGERLLYLPSVGFCLLLAGVAELLLQRRRHLLLAACLIPFLALQATGTVLRNRDWRDNLSLFSSAVQAQPQSVRAQLNYGLALAEQGRWQEAIPPLTRAWRQRPDLLVAAVHLAIAYDLTRQPEQAAALFAELFARRPQDPLLAENYLRFLRRHGRTDRARSIAEEHRQAAGPSGAASAAPPTPNRDSVGQ